MLRPRWARLAGALAFSLAACTPPAATSTAAPSATAPPVVPSTLAPASSTPPPILLTLWLPPFLAPDVNQPAGSLLAERLQSFEDSHPGVQLAVRVKESEGASGLLETLRAASVVAPDAVPDLIALSPGDLAVAAEEEVVQPYPGPLPPPQEEEWFEFALASASAQGTRYGVPSAGQTDVLVYDVSAYGRLPSDWAAIVGGPAPFLFPAADPRAAFTLAQYLAASGPLVTPQGGPAIDPGSLEGVLTFFGSAYSAGVLPLTSRQYTMAAETADVFAQHRAVSAVAPLETWMADPPPGSAAGALPTRDGSGVALARTWTWSVVTKRPQVQAIAVDLVEWLSDPEFLGAWTYALGSLPPNAAALENWPAGTAKALVQQLAVVAQPLPSRVVADIVGPALHKAVEAVLSGAMTPQTAALQASTEVAGP